MEKNIRVKGTRCEQLYVGKNKIWTGIKIENFPEYEVKECMRLLLFMVGLFYFNLSYAQEKGGLKVEKAFDTYINDSTSIQVNLCYNKQLPDHYVSHVETPVCKDGLCYLMVIDIYWDLLGNFHKYELPEQHPLTKFDHEEFTEKDHEKMAEILSNKDSFLRFYSLENLIDTTEQKSSNVVDGVSGATHKSIQSDVVGGAVFSTYVLWHIVNGQVAGQILDHTEARFSDSLMVHFLGSSNYHYQYYVLNKITEKNRQEYLAHIIRLIAKGSNYVPYFAIEKITEEDWELPETQVEIIKLLGEVNFEMENELLNRIKEVLLDESALDILVSKLGTLREGQLIKAVAILKNNQQSLTDESMSKIANLTAHPNKEISAQIALILEGRENFQ